MFKALVLLVLTSLASVASVQAADAPAATTVAAPESYIPPTSPSFFDFLSSGGLTNIAKYCALDMPDRPNQWLHGFICSTHVSDVAIGVYMGLLVIVVVGLVLLVVLQYDMSVRTTRQQLRAYLLIESVMRVGEHDDHPEFQIVMKNYGQTPAYHVRSWILIRPGEREGQGGLPEPNPGLAEVSDAALGPGGSFSMAGRYDNDWDEAGLEDFESGRLALYVYGEVSYRDTFRRRHHTKFRAMYAAEHFRPGTLSIAARGNESN